MGNEMLSQEEIDALIRAVQDQPADNAAAEEPRLPPPVEEPVLPDLGSSFMEPRSSSVESPVDVQMAQFPPMEDAPSREKMVPGRIDFLLEVPLAVTVELGRTKKKLRDVLSFSVGSVVQLDKLAGESVDVLVNGRPVAKGEVVVIDENFGVRITEIKSPAERVHHLT